MKKEPALIVAPESTAVLAQQPVGGSQAASSAAPKRQTMRFLETEIAGAYLIEPARNQDERGFFARTFCGEEFALHGINSRIAQCSVSFNPRKGTLRGMHYQIEPHAETKLVRCTRGAIYDVLVDLRHDSPTFLRWIGAELNEQNGKMFAIPEGIAHGFLTLADETEVFYQISEVYHPECSRGVRWNDPAFEIRWPAKPTLISQRDANFDLMPSKAGMRTVK